MKKENDIARIDLTPEQKQLVKKEIAKDAEAVELTAHELEERLRRYFAPEEAEIIEPQKYKDEAL